MIGIVLMSYGSPNSINETGEFFKQILQGKQPNEQQLAMVEQLYSSLETYDLLSTVTYRQAKGLRELLQPYFSEEIRVYPAFKNGFPFIEDSVQRLVEEKATTIVALPLIPFYSQTGVGSYFQIVEQTIEKLNANVKVVKISNWYDDEQLVSVIASRVQAGLNWLGGDAADDISVIFTAHSQRGNVATHREYDAQFKQLATAAARKANAKCYQIAFRSAGPNKDIWLGPFLEDVIRQEKDKGIKGIVVCDLFPFIENAEVMNDIDPKLKSFVESEGMKFVRCEFLNDSTDFMLAITNIVKKQLLQ